MEIIDPNFADFCPVESDNNEQPGCFTGIADICTGDVLNEYFCREQSKTRNLLDKVLQDSFNLTKTLYLGTMIPMIENGFVVSGVVSIQYLSDCDNLVQQTFTTKYILSQGSTSVVSNDSSRLVVIRTSQSDFVSLSAVYKINGEIRRACVVSRDGEGKAFGQIDDSKVDNVQINETQYDCEFFDRRPQAITASSVRVPQFITGDTLNEIKDSLLLENDQACANASCACLDQILETDCSTASNQRVVCKNDAAVKAVAGKAVDLFQKDIEVNKGQGILLSGIFGQESFSNLSAWGITFHQE